MIKNKVNILALLVSGNMSFDKKVYIYPVVEINKEEDTATILAGYKSNNNNEDIILDELKYTEKFEDDVDLHTFSIVLHNLLCIFNSTNSNIKGRVLFLCKQDEIIWNLMI